MSGGHITGYSRLPEIADEIEILAIENPELGPEVLGLYSRAAAMARQAYQAIRAVDYLDAGDYGRGSFITAWAEYVEPPADMLRGDVVVRLKRPDGYDGVRAEVILDDAHIHPAFRAEIVRTHNVV